MFAEPLPGGWVGAVRVLAFAAVIAGAVLLAARAKAVEPGAAIEKPSSVPAATSPSVAGQRLG